MNMRRKYKPQRFSLKPIPFDKSTKQVMDMTKFAIGVTATASVAGAVINKLKK